MRALGWPTRAVEVEVQPLNIWGTEALELTRTLPVQRTTTDRGTAPPLTGPAAADAAAAFEKLIEAVLDSASNEVAVRRLGEALGRASRQLNTLEKRLRPQLEHDIGRVRRTLDEREREDHTRLTRLNRRNATRRG